MRNETRYETRGWRRVLPTAALLFTGLCLLLIFYTGGRAFSFWMGVTAVGLSIVQSLHERRNSVLVLSESGISLSRGPVWRRLQIDFSMVLSWYSEGRKLVFATGDGKTRKIDLFDLNEFDREDVRTKLTEYLGEPNRRRLTR